MNRLPRFLTRAAIVGAVAASAIACGALIGVTDPDLEKDTAGKDAGTPRKDGGNVVEECDADRWNDPRNCGTCGNDCGGKACQEAKCEGDTTSKDWGDIQQLVVGGAHLFVSQQDGIYRAPKAPPFVGEQISTIKGARLSADATNLYAVGKNEGGKTVAALCAIPCGGEDAWRTLADTPPTATSIVVAPTGKFLVGKDALWRFDEIALTASPVTVGGGPIGVDERNGWRVRGFSNKLYWIVPDAGGPKIRALYMDKGDAQLMELKCQEPPCPSSPADVQLTLESPTKIVGLMVEPGQVHLMESLLSSKRFTLKRSVSREGIWEETVALPKDVNTLFVRHLHGISRCKFEPNIDSISFIDAPGMPILVDEPDAIVSMAADGATLYYAVVTNRGHSDATGRIAVYTN